MSSSLQSAALPPRMNPMRGMPLMTVLLWPWDHVTLVMSSGLVSAVGCPSKFFW